MIIRFRYKVAGGHTHVRVFAGPHDGALGKCGDLVFRNDEWFEFRARMHGVEAMLEDDGLLRNQPPATGEAK